MRTLFPLPLIVVAISIALMSSSCAPVQPAHEAMASTSGRPRHLLFFVDTGAATYSRGCLATAYPQFIESQIGDLNAGDTVTVIAYSADAGFYPPNTTPTSPNDVLTPILQKIDSAREYWKSQYHANHDLSQASEAFVRLDKALELGIKDMDTWGENDDVNLYFLTDGGAGFRPDSADPKKARFEVDHARNEIARDFDELAHDHRVSGVTLYGLSEEERNLARSDFFPRSITEQWLYTWLKGAPNVRNRQVETD